MLLPYLKCINGCSLILGWNPSLFSKAYCDPHYVDGFTSYCPTPSCCSWSGPSSLPHRGPYTCHSLYLGCSFWLFTWLTPAPLSSHSLNIIVHQQRGLLGPTLPLRPPNWSMSPVIYSHATLLFFFLANTLIWNDILSCVMVCLLAAFSTGLQTSREQDVSVCSHM